MRSPCGVRTMRAAMRMGSSWGTSATSRTRPSFPDVRVIDGQAQQIRKCKRRHGTSSRFIRNSHLSITRELIWEQTKAALSEDRERKSRTQFRLQSFPYGTHIAGATHADRSTAHLWIRRKRAFEQLALRAQDAEAGRHHPVCPQYRVAAADSRSAEGGTEAGGEYRCSAAWTWRAARWTG